MRRYARACRGRLLAPAAEQSERIGELAVEWDVESEHSAVQRAGAAARQHPELAARWCAGAESAAAAPEHQSDRKSTRLNSSHH